MGPPTCHFPHWARKHKAELRTRSAEDPAGTRTPTCMPAWAGARGRRAEPDGRWVSQSTPRPQGSSYTQPPSGLGCRVSPTSVTETWGHGARHTLGDRGRAMVTMPGRREEDLGRSQPRLSYGEKSTRGRGCLLEIVSHRTTWRDGVRQARRTLGRPGGPARACLLLSMRSGLSEPLTWGWRWSQPAVRAPPLTRSPGTSVGNLWTAHLVAFLFNSLSTLSIF